MKELIKQYLDHGMSRRQLMTGLSALGMSAAAAKSVAQSLATFGQGGRPARFTPGWRPGSPVGRAGGGSRRPRGR